MWVFFLFKLKTAYEMRISDWSSDVCSSDLGRSVAPCDETQARLKAGPTQFPSTYRRFARMRSEEHTSELQSLMRISYAVFCLKKKKNTRIKKNHAHVISTTSRSQLAGAQAAISNTQGNNPYNNTAIR